MHSIRFVLGFSHGYVLALQLAGLILVVSTATGCTRDKPQPAATARPGSAALASSEPGVRAPAPNSDGAGIVLATMNSGGYTYAQVERGGERVWAAGPETKLEVGARLGPIGGQVMTDFHSNTLNRTFDQIYFITTWPTPGGGAAAMPHAGAAEPHAMGADPHAPAADPHAGVTGKPSAPVAPSEKIAPATGGKTIAQVFGSKDALTGKPVVVRGKVTKFNAGILGRNWIHLQDGTGAAGTNDLTVTTAETAPAVAVGEVIVARGTLATNKDFGGGYAYPVLVEDAAITK